MSDEEQAFLFIVGSILVALYMLPTIIAFARGHANRWLIMVINVVFGGTGLGWLGCLIWAFHVVHKPLDGGGSRGGESGLNLAVNDPLRPRYEPTLPLRTSSDDKIDQLERLQRLRDAAVINQAEFDRLRRDVILQD